MLVPHRKPATISPNDGEEYEAVNVDVSSQSDRRHTTSNNARQSSSAGSEGDDVNADDEDDLSEGDNDLSGLNIAFLQKKISSEVKSNCIYLDTYGC